MNKAIFQENCLNTVPNSMFRKRRAQYQINFKRRRRKHEIDLKPQSPLLITIYLKNLLPHFFRLKKAKSKNTINFDSASNYSCERRNDISSALGEIIRNFFVKNDLPVQTEGGILVSSPESSLKLKKSKIKLKKSKINLNKNPENDLPKKSSSATKFLDVDFFSPNNPLQYSVYPVHIFHYKRNISDNKYRSNPETSQDRKAEVIYERKYDDKKKCKAAKHNVKTSTKGLQLYSNTSTQFEDVSNELSNLSQPQVTHKLAEYFEIHPVPVTNSKGESLDESVTNITTFAEYLDTNKGKSVLLNSHGKTLRKRTSPDRNSDKFLCHRVNLSSDDSTNKSSSNEDVHAVYKKCKKCSLGICNCANSIGNQKGSGNMSHNDNCTSTTEMCICSAMYPKFKEWYHFNSHQFSTDLKKWQEARKLNICDKEHRKEYKLIKKNQAFSAMQEEDEEVAEKLSSKNMVDKSVIVGCLSAETAENVQNVENQRYPTFIGMPIENDKPVKEVTSTAKKGESRKKKVTSSATLAEKESEFIEGNTPKCNYKNQPIKPYRDKSITKGPSAEAQRSNPKTECQINVLRKSDFELVTDIEKIVENLISNVPSLSKSICKTIASQSNFQKEPAPAVYWTTQEEPKPAEYWTLQKMSCEELTPNLQLQPLNCYHLNQTQQTFQQPQTKIPLSSKRTKPESESKETTIKLEKQISSQIISNLPKLQHVSATAITISEPEISHTRTDAKLKKSAVKLSMSDLIQSRNSESKLDQNPKKKRQCSDRISTITYIKKRDTLSPSKETQIFIKTQKDKKIDSNLNVIRSKVLVSTKSSQSSSKSSVQSFIKSLLLCLNYSNSDSQVSLHDISIQCSESTRDLLLKGSASNNSLKATEKTESFFSSYSSDAIDAVSVENSGQLRNEETNTVTQKTVEKSTMKTNTTNSVGVQVYITTKQVKDKRTSASSLSRRRRKKRKQREASTQTYFDSRKLNLNEVSSSSISLDEHKRQDHQPRHRQHSRKRKVITKKLQTSNLHNKEIGKLEKQFWNNFCNFILRFTCGSSLSLSNRRQESESTVDNVVELNIKSSAASSKNVKSSPSSEILKKSDCHFISMPDIPTQIQVICSIRNKTEDCKPKQPKSLDDIGIHNQNLQTSVECDDKSGKIIKNETTAVYPVSVLMSRTTSKGKFKSKNLQCNEIDFQLCSSLNKILYNEQKNTSTFTECIKNTSNNNNTVSCYQTSEESIFGTPVTLTTTRCSNSSSDSTRNTFLFKSNTIPEDEFPFTSTECSDASSPKIEINGFQSSLTSVHFENQLKIKTDIQSVFQLNIANMDTNANNDHVLKSHVEKTLMNESSEQYTFENLENLENKPIDDEHILRLRFLWLKSGLRKHISQLSNLKIMPIYDSDRLKRPSMTSDTFPSPILMKIGAKPFDFEIVKEEKQKESEKGEESENTESVTTESTDVKKRDAFTPIAQLVTVLDDKGTEKFEICAILSVSSDSEEEGMEFAKVIESEEGMKAFLKTMEVVPREIPKLKREEAGCRCKKPERSEIKIDDMDMTRTPSKLIITVPLPKKERKEQKIDCLEQLKRKLGKIFSNKYVNDADADISFTEKKEATQLIDTIYEEEPPRRQLSHIIIDTSNKAYKDKIRKDETKRKFPTFKEIVDTLPDDIKCSLGKSEDLNNVPKESHKTKLPTFKGFKRTAADKFKYAEQKIKLDNALPGAPMQERHDANLEALKGKTEMSKDSNKIQPPITKSKRIESFKPKKCSCNQYDATSKNIPDDDGQKNIHEELHNFLSSERIAEDRDQEMLSSSSDIRENAKAHKSNISLRKPKKNHEIDETSISTERKIEEIRAKLRKVLGEDGRTGTAKDKVRGFQFNPFKEKGKPVFQNLKSNIPVRKTSISSEFNKPSAQEDYKKKLKNIFAKREQESEPVPCRTHLKFDALLNRLSKKFKETNDKIKQSIGSVSHKAPKSKTSRDENLIGVSKESSQQEVAENEISELLLHDFTTPYSSKEQVNDIKSEDSEKIELSKRTLNGENPLNQSRKEFLSEIEAKSISSCADIKDENETYNSEKGSKIKREEPIEIKSINLKFRNLKRERRRDNKLKKFKTIKTIEKESQTVVECKCPRNNHLNGLEKEDASHHSLTVITWKNLSRRNFQSQLNSKESAGRLICDCKELTAIKEISVRENSLDVKSEHLKTITSNELKSSRSLSIALNKIENFEKPLSAPSDFKESSVVPSTSKKNSTVNVDAFFFAGSSGNERDFFKVNDNDYQPREKAKEICRIKYCGIQHPVLNGEGSFFKNDRKTILWKPNYCGLEDGESSKINETNTFNKTKIVLPGVSWRGKIDSVEMESLQEKEFNRAMRTSYDNKDDIILGTNASCLEQIREEEECTSECQTRNFCCSEKCYVRHTRETPRDESPFKMCHRNKQKFNEIELKINQNYVESFESLLQRKASHSEMLISEIDLPFYQSNFWRPYFTRHVKSIECYNDSKCNTSSHVSKTSFISIYDAIFRTKSNIKDEEDLFTFRLSNSNSESNNFIIEETPSYLLVPIRQSQDNSFHLDQRRSLKILYPRKSEINVLPNKFSQNYTSINSVCKLDSISDPKFSCTVFDTCSDKISSAIDLCPTSFRNYYRNKLRKLLENES